MHSIARKPPSPDVSNILADFQTDPLSLWSDQSFSKERRTIRTELRKHFGGICAYCEAQCEERAKEDDGDMEPLDRGTTDHFRPRDGVTCVQDDTRDLTNCKCSRSNPDNRIDFASRSCEWNNLMYVCYRCNQIKGNCWPIRKLPGEQAVLAEGFPNPNQLGLAERIFRYDVSSGSIEVNEAIKDLDERQLARHLIDFLNLDSYGEYPNDNGKYPCREVVLGKIKERELSLPLPQQRQAMASAVVGLLEASTDEDREAIWNYVKAGAVPFSSFVREYVRQKRPELLPRCEHGQNGGLHGN